MLKRLLQLFALSALALSTSLASALMFELAKGL